MRWTWAIDIKEILQTLLCNYSPNSELLLSSFNNELFTQPLAPLIVDRLHIPEYFQPAPGLPFLKPYHLGNYPSSKPQ